MFPSREEGFGLVALESQACGTPPVVTNVGGFPEVVSDQTGWLFEKDNSDELSEIIKGILDNPDTAKNKGKAGSEHVINGHVGWIDKVKQLETIFFDIIK